MKQQHNENIKPFLKVDKDLDQERWINHIENFSLNDLASMSVNLGSFFASLTKQVLDTNKMSEGYDDQAYLYLYDYADGLKIDGAQNFLNILFALAEAENKPVKEVAEEVVNKMAELYPSRIEAAKEKQTTTQEVELKK